MAEDQESQLAWLERLAQLNAVVAAQGSHLAGNLFYSHNRTDYLLAPPEPWLRPKRDRFRQAVSDRLRLLEVGVNGGHSAYLALTTNQDLEFHGVDICSHPYVLPAIDWLRDAFPDRVQFYEGSSVDVLSQLVERGLSFDAFHIDGAKETYYHDIVNSSRMVSAGAATVIVDDIRHPGVSRRWRRCVRQRLVVTVPEFPRIPEADHMVGAVLPSSNLKWRMLITYSCALNLQRQARERVAQSRGRTVATAIDGG
jgi:predicted O-methyltransferase YrrM